jgi:phytoene dehydrogenase-like protein
VDLAIVEANSVVVIGAGVGGLSAAIYLAQHGLPVTVVEASPFTGGLASSFMVNHKSHADRIESIRFDGGPYILLDRPGLSWAFDRLGLSVGDALALKSVTHVYEVHRKARPSIGVYASLDETAHNIERSFPGNGLRYRRFIGEMTREHARLLPLLTHDHPGPRAALETGAALALPTLLRSLASVLRRADLAPEVCEALGIWTHIAGQTLQDAPSPLAFVNALIHGAGCFVPERGIGHIPEVLTARAQALGVRIRTSAPVRSIDRDLTVTLETGEALRARAVVSNAGGPKTLLQLARGMSELEPYIEQLPLQSPGVAAYLLLRNQQRGAHLQFWLGREDARAPSRLIVRPSCVQGTLASFAEAPMIPARLVAPLAHDAAQALGAEGQAALLAQMLEEADLFESIGAFEVVHVRTPRGYGARHHLYQDAMNPVMTAAFMRRGRLPHRLPSPKGLYLVGSSTHPGQWVSFCAISGVLGARKLLHDLRIDTLA